MAQHACVLGWFDDPNEIPPSPAKSPPPPSFDHCRGYLHCVYAIDPFGERTSKSAVAGPDVQHQAALPHHQSTENFEHLAGYGGR
jgi:hypothetical protein